MGASCSLRRTLTFANGGFVYKFNDATAAALPKEARAKVEEAKAALAAGKLPLDWKSVKF